MYYVIEYVRGCYISVKRLTGMLYNYARGCYWMMDLFFDKFWYIVILVVLFLPTASNMLSIDDI